jgi:hypothetical protein
MATSQYNAFIRLLKDTEVTSQVDSGRRRAGDGAGPDGRGVRGAPAGLST